MLNKLLLLCLLSSAAYGQGTKIILPSAGGSVVAASSYQTDKRTQFVRDSTQDASVVIKVASFALAKTQITVGTPKRFIIANNELYNASTQSTYDGANWYHSPAELKNN